MGAPTYDAVVPDRGDSASRGRSVWNLLIGRPLRASEASKEKINPVEGLSALSLDALTSVAYGPEAIIVVLAGAGAGALHVVFAITIAIVVLLAVLVFSYRQVIDAYPGGGGAYAVSRANLGRPASLVAGASLVVDYTLTVAVSIAAGVGALTSAFPSLSSATVPLCLGILALITLLNLRGLGETARAFLLPTLVFIVGLLAIIAIGLFHPLALHAPQPGHSVLPTKGLQTVGVLLVLKAFSAGCSASTGVEAIANGVPLFKEPRARRAKRTEMLLGLILGTMLLGLATLARRFHIGPRSNQTVLSQIMGMAVGRHWAYFVVSLTITLVLALAANTSFGGLPILASLLARDDYLPHLFSLRGDRQVYANGIVVLAVLSGVLLVAADGNTIALIPLYAIGVFTGFTLAQSGLVVHWWRSRPPRWRHRAAINGIGALITAVATVIFLISKFENGAWVVVVAVPALVFLFVRIHRYYRRAGARLGVRRIPAKPQGQRTQVIVPVTGVSRLAEHALSEALSLGDEVVAVSVVLDTGEGGDKAASDLERAWSIWDPGVELKVLRTDYASVVEPIVAFIDEARATGDHQIVVLIPVVVPDHFRHRPLHNQIDLVLSRALRSRTDIVVARVPVPLGAASEREESARRARCRHPSVTSLRSVGRRWGRHEGDGVALARGPGGGAPAGEARPGLDRRRAGGPRGHRGRRAPHAGAPGPPPAPPVGRGAPVDPARPPGHRRRPARTARSPGSSAASTRSRSGSPPSRSRPRRSSRTTSCGGCTRDCPRAGEIGIFNRSHYEDVLAVRVRKSVPEEVWRPRFGHINAFEALLHYSGTTLIKVFLHISKAEQEKRLDQRQNDPDKAWKVQSSDFADRTLWGDYEHAFEDMLRETSTPHAPWYVVPADHKWYRNWVVTRILLDTLEAMDPQIGPGPPH